MTEKIIALLKDLVTEDLRDEIWTQCKSSNWAFGHGSGSDSNVADFWKMDLDGNAVIDRFWQAARGHCEKLAGKQLKVIRQYANGHTYGLGGRPHQDDDREGCYTLLYYPMPNWHDLWDGETVFYNDQNEIRTAIKPQPNRAVFFDSRILHVGRAPSRYFGGLRVTVALKLEVDGSQTSG